MAPIINQVLNEILKSCKSEAGFAQEHEKKAKEAFSLDSDSEDEDEIVGINVDINFIDEKSAAVHALGNIALFCSGLILPRINEIVGVLGEIKLFFHENIRYHVCMTYLQIAVGLTRHFTGSEDFPWVKGLPVKVALPPQVTEFLNTVVLPHYFELFEAEDSKEVIEKTLECIREMCEEYGPSSIVDHADKLVETLLLLLDKKAFCQVKGAGSGNKGDGEEEEDD
jgi:hypothetical protein